MWLRSSIILFIFALERAPRVPARALAPGRPPRVVVAKLLHYRDRDLLLRRAREAGPFRIANGTVTLFPDFTAEAQNKPASYIAVKRALRDEGIQYSLLFPARLRVVTEDRSTFFQTPDEAWQWLKLHKARGSTTGRVERVGRRSRRGPRRQQSKPQLRARPIQAQKESAKKAALEAVASLQCRDSSMETSGRDSDRASESSKEDSCIARMGLPN
ncbi:hypothetical protein NDU88_008410 [Pleurodeles waltl]|uniref:Uncharacterized protein n=1 Tax=Pleurodeles waltl TaxID=8319 RepID=A0AAV7RVP7_PLEWA|nr:hypothetical protein NDU88_008410 [Pleurodeles waltl]